MLVAAGLAVILCLVVYLAATLGLRTLATNAAETDANGEGELSVPSVVYDAPDTVPVTSSSGPAGPVSVVFAGSEVRDGLTGTLEDPWIAISARSGSYRAIDAPHRPAPGPDAVSVSPDGRTLAWAWEGGVVVYDSVTDESRELAGRRPLVGRFSPDGDRLLVYDGGLRVVEVASGDTLATVDRLGEPSARQAVWTPDGATLTWVADGRLVSYDWQRGRQTAVPAPITPAATLAWQPSGDQLAAMRSQAGVNMVDIFTVSPTGELAKVHSLQPARTAIQSLLGFTSDENVTVVALQAESGAVERTYRLSAVDGTMTPVTQLPAPGPNWLGAEAMAVAAEPLANPATDFGEPRWPWSDGAKLLGSAVLAFFLLGLYLTRRLPKRMRPG
jgi:hypothetical protein